MSESGGVDMNSPAAMSAERLREIAEEMSENGNRTMWPMADELCALADEMAARVAVVRPTRDEIRGQIMDVVVETRGRWSLLQDDIESRVPMPEFDQMVADAVLALLAEFDVRDHPAPTQRCWCCDGPYTRRERASDPWEGRLDGYCYDCATTRCDAHPGQHADQLRERVAVIIARFWSAYDSPHDAADALIAEGLTRMGGVYDHPQPAETGEPPIGTLTHCGTCRHTFACHCSLHEPDGGRCFATGCGCSEFAAWAERA